MLSAEDDQLEVDNLALQLNHTTIDQHTGSDRYQDDEPDNLRRQQQDNYIASDDEDPAEHSDSSHRSRKMDDVIVEDDSASTTQRAARYSSSERQQATSSRTTAMNGASGDATSGGRRLSRLENLLRQQIVGADITTQSTARATGGGTSGVMRGEEQQQQQRSVHRSPSGPRYDWLGTGLDEVRSTTQQRYHVDQPQSDDGFSVRETVAASNASYSLPSPSQRRPSSVDRVSSSSMAGDRRAQGDVRPPSGPAPSASLPRPLDTSTPLLSRSRSVESVVSGSTVGPSPSSVNNVVGRVQQVGTRLSSDSLHHHSTQKLFSQQLQHQQQQQQANSAPLPTPIQGSVSSSVANFTLDDEDLTRTFLADRKSNLTERTVVDVTAVNGGHQYSSTKESGWTAGHVTAGQRGGQQALMVKSPLVTARTSRLSAAASRPVTYSSPVFQGKDSSHLVRKFISHQIVTLFI